MTRPIRTLAAALGLAFLAACASPPEGCVRESGQPIPLPSGGVIMTPETVHCPRDFSGQGA